MMRRLPVRPLRPRPPAGTRLVVVDRASGRRSQADCGNVVELPFLAGSPLPPAGDCASPRAPDATDPAPAKKPGKLKKWFKKLLGG